jgi:dethiobiotin synthetase
MSNLRGYFITGTDTEVGKTWITAAMATAMRHRGRAPVALKPLATGSAPPGEDATQIAAAAGHPPRVFACMPDPASPDRAAIQIGSELEMLPILEWIRGHEGTLLVEGVGGWEVPIGPDFRVSDVATELQLPVILVAADRLGVLNHTLLTAAAIRGRGLRLAAIILNRFGSDEGPLSAWNLEDLRRHIDVPVIPIAHALPRDLAEQGLAILDGLEP